MFVGEEGEQENIHPVDCRNNCVDVIRVFWTATAVATIRVRISSIPCFPPDYYIPICVGDWGRPFWLGCCKGIVMSPRPRMYVCVRARMRVRACACTCAWFRENSAARDLIRFCRVILDHINGGNQHLFT